MRSDAPEGARGKPCGKSYIPKRLKCGKPISKAAIAAIGVLGTAALAAGIAVGRSSKLKNESANTSALPRLAGQTISRDERFGFAPEQFQADLAKLSEPTKKALLDNHNQSALQVLEVNAAKDYVIAKFDSPPGRYMNEHLGVSSVSGRPVETRVESEGRFSDRWHVQFTIDRSLTRRRIKRVGETSLPKESISSTRRLQKRITSMMLAHIKHLPPEATLVASAVEADGGGRGRNAIYRRYGFNPNPESANREIETEVSIAEFIKQASARADSTSPKTRA